MLSDRLNGEFREIRRYRPSRMPDLEAPDRREAPGSGETVVSDEDADDSDN